VSSSAVLRAADWPRFRGPDGSGSTSETGLPLTWSDSEGVLWKTELPGPGSSSPILSRGRAFVTCFSGYATSRDDIGDPTKLRRHVVCADAKTGKLLWDRSIESKLPEATYGRMGLPEHGFASSTPVADGERVYAFFGRSGVVAYDFEGKELWRAAVAPDPRTHGFGSASSPVLHDDLVIVPASIECESIVAFDKLTGAEVWRAPAQGYGEWWGTPIVVESGGQADVVVSVPGELWGLNPKTGKLRWYAETFAERNICPSAVAASGVVYAIGGRQAASAAVKLGGRGDVSKTHVAWKGSQGSYVTSPVIHAGHLYWVNDRGVATCVSVETGAEVNSRRLEGAGGVYASALLAEGRLYVVTRRNGTLVLEAKPEMAQLAHNKLAADSSQFNASPAVADGRIYLRSDRYFYAIGKGS
jgi:hypothetical protein